MPVGRKVFLAVVLSQLFSIALIFGWYFYALRSELDSLTQQRAQEVVLRSIAATEDYFIPAETTVDHLGRPVTCAPQGDGGAPQMTFKIYVRRPHIETPGVTGSGEGGIRRVLAQVEGVGQAGRGALVNSLTIEFWNQRSFGDLMSADMTW